jgi:hypothetical protein
VRVNVWKMELEAGLPRIARLFENLRDDRGAVGSFEALLGALVVGSHVSGPRWWESGRSRSFLSQAMVWGRLGNSGAKRPTE